jgi:hypothetical protein
MNTDEHIRIEKLIGKFFDGATSNDEERELYHYFRNKDLPASLQPFRELFNYIEKDLPAALETAQRPAGNKRIRMLGSVAAAAVIAFGVFLNISRQENNPFEGSYIIRNGVRITDPKIIRPELEATLRLVALQEEEAEHLRSQMNDPYEEFLQQIPDTETREIAREFLLSR